MEKVESFLAKYFWLIILILSMPAWWALLVPGFYGASDDIHIAWLHQMHRVILTGKFPPRFVPDLSFGFGYPLFNFVFPLPFYIAEIFHLLGLSLVDSVKFLFFLTIPLSGIAMFYLLRQFLGVWLSLVGSILYIYTPYRALDIYIRGAIGEILSFVFLPLVVLSLIKIAKEKNFRWIAVGGLSLASLLLSHNISAYMFFLFIALYIILQIIFSASKKKLIVKSFLMIFLAFLISSYFWLPAIVDLRLMKYDTVFNFADHYPTILQLITPYWGYGASVAGPGDGMSFFLGIVNILLISMGIFYLFKYFSKFSKFEKAILIWSLASFLVAIFFMNHRSLIFWQIIPFLPYFQFPWRFLIMTTFFAPLMIISLKYFKYANYLALVVIILAVISTSSYFRPQDFLGRDDNYYINRYIPTPLASSEYLETGEEYLRLPKNAEYRPNRNYPLVTLEGGEIKNISKINSLDTKVEVFSENGGVLNFNKYNFPGWTAKIDGNLIDVTSAKPFGQVQISIPAGEHGVEIYFQETNFKKVLDIISIVAFLVSLVIILK